MRSRVGGLLAVAAAALTVAGCSAPSASPATITIPIAASISASKATAPATATVTATVTVTAIPTTTAAMTVTRTLTAIDTFVAPTTAGDPGGTTPTSVPVTAVGPVSPPAGLESEGNSVAACRLLDRSEAETLAATPLQKSVQTDPHYCVYTAPVTGPTAQVEVFVGPGALKTLNIERALGHHLRALKDIGDEAWAEPNAAFVRSGTLWVTVHLVRLNDSTENDGRLEAALAIIGDRL